MAQVEVKVKLDLPPGVELLGYDRSGDGHEPKEWRQCFGIAVSSGVGQLQNSLGYVAQAETSNGTSWSGSAARSR
jgi:hypothetical protein